MFVGHLSVFFMADLAFAVRRCVDPRPVDVLIKFSQWRGPQTFAIMEESIVNHNVNPLDLFPVLLRGAVLL